MRGVGRARLWLTIAAIAGVVHGLFSLYWAAGGNWLMSTLGSGLNEAFDGKRWLLYPVAAVKIAGAVLPLLWTLRGWPTPRFWYWLCWLGAAALIVWGGINTVTGNLVLSGLVDPSGGYDRDGMIGHAWLWDPLFLLWGVTLALGLHAARPGRRPTGG